MTDFLYLTLDRSVAFIALGFLWKSGSRVGEEMKWCYQGLEYSAIIGLDFGLFPDILNQDHLAFSCRPLFEYRVYDVSPSLVKATVLSNM